MDVYVQAKGRIARRLVYIYIKYIYIYPPLLDPLRRKIRLDSAFEWVDEKEAKRGQARFYKVGKGRSLSLRTESKRRSCSPSIRAARVSKRQGLPQDRMYRFFSSSSSFSSFRIVVCMITSVQRNRGRWKGTSSGKSLPADFGRVRARVIARSCA